MEKKFLKLIEGNKGTMSKKLNGIVFENDNDLVKKVSEQGAKVITITKETVFCTYKKNQYTLRKEQITI